MTANFTERLADAESTLASLTSSTGNDEDTLVADARAIATIVREAEEILRSIDASELPDAIDADRVREAIELGELPDTVREEENADVVKLRQVVRAIDLGRALKAMDVSDVFESKREIDDATDELVDDEEANESILDTDMDGTVDAVADELREDVDVGDGNMSEYQALIQQQAIKGIDAFRDGLLKTHGKFEQVVETNREKMRRQDRSPSSRNPTAVSTMPTTRSDVSSVPNYATMPRTVRHSDAPTRTHIYGDRFRREREKRGYDA